MGGASLDTPERARAYDAAAQRDLNVHLRRLGSPTVLAVDGEWDADTQLAFERVCRILGIDAVRDARTFRLIGASVADRTDAEKQRAQTDGAAFEQQLKAQFAANAGQRQRQRRAARAEAQAGPSSAAARCRRPTALAPTSPRSSATSTAT